MLQRFILAGLVLALPLSAVADTPPSAPPAQWADYFAAVRKADAIVDDEARCVAYPDLPGNEWVAGAAKARCGMLRAPAMSLDEIDRRLATKEGTAELEARFAALLDAHYKDQAQREQIFRAFVPFDESERAGIVAERWLKLAPKSAFAHAALGHHHSDAGWNARGTAYVDKTPAAKLQVMQDEFVAAVPLLAKALELEPRLSPACTWMTAIGRQSSDELQRHAMGKCTKIDPDSYYLALERIFQAEPRWGGSEAEHRLAVAYAAARVERNPVLGALLGEAAGYAPSIADKPESVTDELAAVSRMAPSGTLMSYAARGYRNKGDEWSALVYYSQALRFWPRNADWRYERAGRWRNVGDYEWAFRDMQVALEVEPDAGWNQYRMGQIMRQLRGEAAARPFLKRALDFPDSRQQAMLLYCQGFKIEKALKELGDCTREFVAEYPTYGEAWRQRAWYLDMVRSAEADDAFEKFMLYADPDNPLHQKEVAELKQWEQQQKKARK